ncbi:MAG: 6,7-dimethyl-8-ribityllumazine synthase [Pseudorhodoplanes sp.]
MAQARRRASAKKNTGKKTSSRAKLHILVVEARFYDDIADHLLKGAVRALEEAGATFDRVTLRGALEIPAAVAIAADAAVRKKRPYDGVVALGCVIQGETFHFDIVAMQSARGLMDVSIAHRLPAGNAILTVDTNAQALARAHPDQGDKGGEAVKAMLDLLALKRGGV